MASASPRNRQCSRIISEFYATFQLSLNLSENVWTYPLVQGSFNYLQFKLTFSFRETACSLLTNSEYFLNDDFTRNKADLLEKIHRFNAPVRHIIPKQSKSDLKFPTSTSKIQLTNPQGKRNKHQKVNAANRSGLQTVLQWEHSPATVRLTLTTAVLPTSIQVTTD